MKRYIIATLLFLAMLLLCGCGAQQKAVEERWLWNSEAITLPSGFDAPHALATAGDDIYVISYSTLGRWNEADSSVATVDTLYREDAPVMVYGASGYGDTLYVLVGELMPEYTLDGQRRENPAYAGSYAIISYCKGERGRDVPFAVGKQNVLHALVMLSQRYALCWADTTAWIIDLQNGDIANIYEDLGTITGSAVSEAGCWLWTRQGYYPLDGKTGRMGEFMAGENTNVCNSVSNTALCLLNDASGLSLYDPARQSNMELCKWGQCDLAGTSLIGIVQINEDTWLCSSFMEAGVWKVSRQSAEGRKTLRIACANGSQELDKLVNDFNATHKDCMAVVDYYPENAYDRLCTEIMAGDGPDILDLSGLSIPPNTPFLEDLYPYIDADKELNRDTFVPTVLSSLQIGERLSSLPAAFTITTLTAKTADVEGMSTWTFDEMRRVLDDHADMQLLPAWLDKLNFLGWVATVSTGSFVDWDSGSARYDGPEFAEYLRFCAALPQWERPAEGDQTLAPQDWPHLVELEYVQNTQRWKAIDQNYGEPFTCIGFPCETGCGSFFSADVLHLAISANSSQKDLAWEWMRSAYSPEFQRELVKQNHLPVRRDVFKDTMEQELSNPRSRQQLLDMVSQKMAFITLQKKITEIIEEEAQPYFDGAVALDSATRRIQERVMLYLAESQS